MHDTRTGARRPARKVKRIPRGIRMPASLWAWVDETAELLGEPNGGRLIERWVAEKRDALEVAA